MGSATCAGGPWTQQYNIVNPNIADGNQPPLASADAHTTFSTFAIPSPVDPTSAPVRDAVSLVNRHTTPTKSFNPNNIHAAWAKSFALSNSQNIYYMKMAANPTVSHQLKFQIWSTKSQTVNIKLINGTTGLEAYSASMELSEGKNIKSIAVSTSINGTHVLQVTSSNVLSANVVIN